MSQVRMERDSRQPSLCSTSLVPPGKCGEWRAMLLFLRPFICTVHTVAEAIERFSSASYNFGTRIHSTGGSTSNGTVDAPLGSSALGRIASFAGGS
eukprot:COSAG02_NODE_851_length_16536_cov_6.254000_10_plen_96_part_00